MFRYIFTLAVFSFVTLLGAEPRSVAVLDFETGGKIDPSDAYIMSNRLRGLLVSTRAFHVVEREKMREILKEQNFTLTDNCTSSECAVRVGQLLGVNLMIAGTVGHLGSTYTLDLRLIDVQSGQIILAKQKDHTGPIDDFLPTLASVANEFALGQETQNTAAAQFLAVKPMITEWSPLIRVGFGRSGSAESTWNGAAEWEGGISLPMGSGITTGFAFGYSRFTHVNRYGNSSHSSQVPLLIRTEIGLVHNIGTVQPRVSAAFGLTKVSRSHWEDPYFRTIEFGAGLEQKLFPGYILALWAHYRAMSHSSYSPEQTFVARVGLTADFGNLIHRTLNF